MTCFASRYISKPNVSIYLARHTDRIYFIDNLSPDTTSFVLCGQFISLVSPRDRATGFILPRVHLRFATVTLFMGQFISSLRTPNKMLTPAKILLPVDECL